MNQGIRSDRHTQRGLRIVRRAIISSGTSISSIVVIVVVAISRASAIVTVIRTVVCAIACSSSAGLQKQISPIIQ